jgi:hypothetical protein
MSTSFSKRLLKYAVWFVLGFASASVLFIFVFIPSYGREKFDYGYKNGQTAAKFEIGLKLPTALGGDYTKADGYQPFFEVKDMAVLVVERNGVKTLRLYP